MARQGAARDEWRAWLSATKACARENAAPRHWWKVGRLAWEDRAGSTRRQSWLVICDVRRPQRLVRTHQSRSERAGAIHYPAFLVPWNEAQLELAWRGIQVRIRRSQDDFRTCALAINCRLDVRGAPALGSGVALRAEGFELLRGFAGGDKEGDEWTDDFESTDSARRFQL